MQGLLDRLMLVLLILLPAHALAQWSSPQVLTNSSLPSRLRLNSGWAIDVDGRELHPSFAVR